MHAVLLQRGWTVLATSISSLLLEYDVLQLSVELTEGGTQSCERFVSVNWEFSQFSTSSAANSLPVHGTFEGQNKSTLGPEKTKFSVFWNFSSLGFYILSTWCLRKKKKFVSWALKLPCYTHPPTQHHNFLRNLPPFDMISCRVQSRRSNASFCRLVKNA